MTEINVLGTSTKITQTKIQINLNIHIKKQE